jgi:hypothetical protein|tara:strand:- start:18 stop:428 length:411 start_codon:yes stop_codon:yes gene_type:complete
MSRPRPRSANRRGIRGRPSATRPAGSRIRRDRTRKPGVQKPKGGIASRFKRGKITSPLSRAIANRKKADGVTRRPKPTAGKAMEMAKAKNKSNARLRTMGIKDAAARTKSPGRGRRSMAKNKVRGIKQFGRMMFGK